MVGSAHEHQTPDALGPPQGRAQCGESPRRLRRKNAVLQAVGVHHHKHVSGQVLGVIVSRGAIVTPKPRWS